LLLKDKEQDKAYMSQALALAALAKGRTSPNPMVGAVIVKDGKIIGQGWHQKAGLPHAEVYALQEAGDAAHGATLYVTLEPCCHVGRTPACTAAIIAAGIQRVVAAMQDPNPLVAGKGFSRLQEVGIEVEVGLLEEEARCLNEVFIKNKSMHVPFVILKSAATLDGKTAPQKGKGGRITSDESIRIVHELRSRYDAVLTGIGTVLADDTQLTVRLVEDLAYQPIRVVLDYDLRIPLDAKITDISLAPTIIFTASEENEKMRQLHQKGVKIILLAGEDGHFDLREVLSILYEKGIMSVFLEAGEALNGAFWQAGLVDKIYLFLAPKIAGGVNAPGIIGGTGISSMEDAQRLDIRELRHVGQDWLFIAYPQK